ncbi:MAG: molybdopterin-dependent oxidoreductase [Deltaproteobacteria bacterium]|nr:molybdopterin-dependent oxidoreductase [Deltaproteobacteria bacterium]
MKIDRRSFLSFIIGGAAGTTLSPLPWKLMDDMSIWTQMWPWTPVPENGEVSYANSTCTLCPGGCGISVRLIDDRPVKIEGTEGHPVNDGGLCVMGLSGLQLLYGQSRVKGPMKRVGKRGEKNWEQISWDEAISMVAEKLDELRSDGESHTLSCISGSDQGTVPELFKRFLDAYGSVNFTRMPSIDDSYELVLKLMHGVEASAGFDVENTDFLLSFSSGILEGWGSPVRMFSANGSWKKSGGKVVQIDSRLSNTAAKADHWIPINPGNEVVLALGLAHVIIKDSLYNKEFITNYSYNFENWKRVVLNEYSPESVEKVTGINKTIIRALAKDFAGAKKPLAICGKGQGKNPGSTSEFMAVHALNALVGSINTDGGVWAVDNDKQNYIQWPDVKKDSVAESGAQRDRIDGAGTENYPYTRYLPNRFIENINSSNESLVKLLFVHGANPYYTLPDTHNVRKAFEKIPFIVSFSSYMDETALNADLILPNHAYLERYEDVPRTRSFNRPIIGLSKPIIEPQYNTRHSGDVIITKEKKMGGSIAAALSWENYEQCLQETLGDKWETLNENGFWVDETFKVPGWKNAFKTPTLKCDFSYNELFSLPHFCILGIKGDDPSYPLALIPYDSMRLANGFIGDPPFVIKTVEDTVLKGKDMFVDINPDTAKKYGLVEGSKVILKTPNGELKVRVHLFEGIFQNLVAAPRGLGHTGYDKYISGKGANVNELIGTFEDPASGHDAAWGIAAQLIKV